MSIEKWCVACSQSDHSFAECQRIGTPPFVNYNVSDILDCSNITIRSHRTKLPHLTYASSQHNLVCRFCGIIGHDEYRCNNEYSAKNTEIILEY